MVLLVSVGQTVAIAASTTRDTSFEETLAYDLKALGLFKGVSDTDFDLDRAPTRAEAVVMLIRMLGKEDEALNGNWSHPFTDVSPWADSFIGYAYENGLTNGISDTQFGFNNTATANMYLTFVLRSLGYSDTNNEDFSWSNPYSLASSTGILPESVDTETFWRADVVLVSYAALVADINGTSKKLAEKLISEGVFSAGAFSAYYDAEALSNGVGDSTSSATILTASQIYSQCSPAVFYIEVYDSLGSPLGSASGFFIDSNGTAVTNYHVIDGCSSAKITTSDTNKTYDVSGVYNFSVDHDWAVIKVNGSGFSFFEFGDQATIAGGETVYAIGSPLGLQNTITQGIISNPSREEAGTSYIQISAAISSGSSGGALINSYGDVIGITSASYIYGQNLNLAVPISYIDRSNSSGYTSLSDFSDSTAVDDPISYLKNYLINYGTYYEEYSAYSLEMEIANEYYSIDYYTKDDELSLTHIYYYYMSYSYCSATLLIDSPEVTVPNQNPFTFSLYNYGWTVAEGHILASTFSENTSITFDAYSSDTETESDSEYLAEYLLIDLLYATQYMLEYSDIPISIKDLGFTAAYHEYYS